jgi:hypothetical protein
MFRRLTRSIADWLVGPAPHQPTEEERKARSAAYKAIYDPANFRPAKQD